MSTAMSPDGQLTLTGPTDDGGHPITVSTVGAESRMRGTEGVTPLMERRDGRAVPTKEAGMATDFLSHAKAAQRSLQRAQQQRERLEGIARERLMTAREAYELAIAQAAELEGRAWLELLAVPGMNARTAATLGGVSVATVHRRLKEARRG